MTYQKHRTTSQGNHMAKFYLNEALCVGALSPLTHYVMFFRHLTPDETQHQISLREERLTHTLPPSTKRELRRQITRLKERQ